MRHININGRLVKDTSASVPYNNRAFRFGYGIFETMLMRESVIQLKEYHWQRLFDRIEKLGFGMPELMTREWVESERARNSVVWGKGVVVRVEFGELR